MPEKAPVYGKRFGTKDSWAKAESIAKRIAPKRCPEHDVYLVVEHQGQTLFGSASFLVAKGRMATSLTRQALSDTFLKLLGQVPDAGVVPVAFGDYFNRGMHASVVFFADGLMMPSEHYEIIRRSWPAATYHFVEHNAPLIVARSSGEIVAVVGPIPKTPASIKAGRHFATRATAPAVAGEETPR